MAFNYYAVEGATRQLRTDYADLNTEIGVFTDLIDDNVNNSQVWQGQSSEDFKKEWDSIFSTEFDNDKKMFEHQIEIMDTSAKAYHAAEGTSSN